jgi:hypothetical protein
MFYFLIYQSSITEYYDTEKKYLTSFFWGTIAYIFSHALFSSSTAPFAIQLKKSFWLILLIDIGVLLYMYQYLKNKESADNDTSMVDDLLKKMSIGVSHIESNLNEIKQSENDDSDDEVPQPIMKQKNNKKQDKQKQDKQKQEIAKVDFIEPYENSDFSEFDNEIENRTKKLEKDNSELIISPHENNLDFPAQTFSTPLNQLINDNNDNESITLDINFEDDDSGSDIDVDQFEDFIK